MGDFNLNYSQKDFNKHRLVKELKDSKFIQLVSFTTRPISNSCLDHIWSNKPEWIINIKCPEICISYHLPVLAVRLYKHCSPDNTKDHKYVTYRNLKSLDHAKFLKTLDETPWDTAFLFDEVDDIVNTWYCLFNEAVNANVPLKQKRVRDYTKPKWLSPEILRLMKLRDRLLERARRSNSQDDWLALKGAKNKITEAIRRAKNNFFYESFRESRGDSKKIWSALKDLTGQKNHGGVSYLEETGSIQIRDETVMAEIFNEHFTGLAERLADKTVGQFDPTVLKAFVDERKDSDLKIAFPPITPCQTQKLIKAIPSGKATGLDGVSARLLKIAAPVVASSLAKLINICITSGTFPAVWKEAKVTPLHKGNSKADKNNYRSISVLPVLSKIFERHLHNSLYAFLRNKAMCLYVAGVVFWSQRSSWVTCSVYYY